MRKIDRLLLKLQRVEAEVLAELKLAYPIGKKVVYRLRGGAGAHRYPWQEGEVAGYAKDGRRLRVLLAPSRSSRVMGHDRRRVETLPLSKIKDSPSGDRGA